MSAGTSSAFYEPLADGCYRSTEHTIGPWDPRFQHGGPPAALLARTAVDAAEPRDDMVVARVVVEILGPIPVDAVVVRSRVARTGRSVELLESELTAGGRVAARAAVWRVVRSPVTVAGEPLELPPRPDAPTDFTEAPWGKGYLDAVDWRFTSGSFLQKGPATAWTRLLVGLVDGEEPDPLTRVLAVADSGNGLSASMNLAKWWSINPDLTVHLHRLPASEWICVDARTTISTGGAGLATTDLADEEGPVGVGAQSLFVGRRPS